MRRSFAQDVDVVLRRLSGFLIRERRPVLLLALLVTVVGTYFSVHLYANLRSEIEELLPENAPSVIAAKLLGPQLHNVNHLSIVLEGSDPDAMDRFADDLVRRLNALPSSFIETVDYRVDQEEALLQRFGLLFLSVEDLKRILERVKARIAWEKQNANPLLSMIDEPRAPPPPLDFRDIEAKYSQHDGDLKRFRKGYFQTPDGKLLAILVRPPESVTGYAQNRALLDGIKAEIERLKPQSYDPKLKIGFDGEVGSVVEEQEALVADLASSTVIVIVFVLLALWIYFRRWSAIAAIFGSLVVGCAVTFGISYFLVGHLNANTAFLGSIVVGNGINVAIIIVARYVEERRGGLPVDIAIHVALRRTLAATFVAAFASGLAYLSLAVTNFRGFRHFGLIGGLGMAVCWVSAVLLLPPMLSAIESWRDLRVSDSPRKTPITSRIVDFVQRYPRGIRVASIVSLLGVVAAMASYRGELIEYDMTKLRAKKSQTGGSIYWAHRLDQVFNAYLTPVVIVGDTPADLDRVVATLDRRRQEIGDLDPFREVRTIRSAIPDNQDAKIPLLRELRDTLTEARLKLSTPEQRQVLEKFRPPQDIRPLTLKDLPRSIKLPLTERNGRAGRIALAFPRKVGILSSHETEQMTDLVRGSIADSGAQAKAVGQGLLFADITSAILKDGPVATGIAFWAVWFLVLLVFRRLRPSLTVFSGLLLGVAWLVGIGAAARVRINFLNFVVLPITFGIGVDYAVNIVQRYRLEGRGSLPRVLRETGGAVALCSSTTIIGYFSLFAADNQALAGFGLLAALGELSCITAALIALPAFLLESKS
jgi:predicted RND superfamily exporter protein